MSTNFSKMKLWVEGNVESPCLSHSVVGAHLGAVVFRPAGLCRVLRKDIQINSTYYYYIDMFRIRGLDSVVGEEMTRADLVILNSWCTNPSRGATRWGRGWPTPSAEAWHCSVARSVAAQVALCLGGSIKCSLPVVVESTRPSRGGGGHLLLDSSVIGHCSKFKEISPKNAEVLELLRCLILWAGSLRV